MKNELTFTVEVFAKDKGHITILNKGRKLKLLKSKLSELVFVGYTARNTKLYDIKVPAWFARQKSLCSTPDKELVTPSVGAYIMLMLEVDSINPETGSMSVRCNGTLKMIPAKSMLSCVYVGFTSEGTKLAFVWLLKRTSAKLNLANTEKNLSIREIEKPGATNVLRYRLKVLGFTQRTLNVLIDREPQMIINTYIKALAKVPDENFGLGWFDVWVPNWYAKVVGLKGGVNAPMPLQNSKNLENKNA